MPTLDQAEQNDWREKARAQQNVGQDFGPSEMPEQYQPKGSTSFQQAGFLIPPNVDGPVLNHMRVAMCTSEESVSRQRSLAQLRRMCAAGDTMAKAALDAMVGLVIEP